MNKNFWKRFLTWNPHHNDGFTLVELIVVIAILAILAAVAVPAYSGYIEKANRAGDETLLAAVNKAFASACLENGTDVHLIEGAAIDWGTDGRKTVKGAYVYQKGDAYDVAFDSFFLGNENSEFKVIMNIGFSPELGAFVDADTTNVTLSVSYGGGFIKLDTKDLAALENSTFVEKLGVDGMLDKVDHVSSLASVLVGGSLSAFLGDQNFVNHAASAMGINRADYASEEDFQMALYNKAQELATEMANKSGGTLSQNDAFNHVMANAVVLHAAKTASADGAKNDFTTLLTSESAVETIRQNVASGTNIGQAYSQAAVAYGMLTAYAQATGKTEVIESDDLVTVVTNGLNDPEFRAWVAGDGQNDLDAYLAAMNMISNSSDDRDAVSTLLVNGFDDQELKDIFNNALGD